MGSGARRTALIVALTLLVVAVVAGVFFAGRASKSSSKLESLPSSTSSSSTSMRSTTTAQRDVPDLLGNTDPDPTHWVPSDFEKPQRIQVRLFDDQPAIVRDFPVTMNGCDTRQLRVAWRSLETPIGAGFTSFGDPGTPIDVEQQLPDKRTSGTMWLNSCEQPVFIGPGNIENMVVEVAVFEPAAGLITEPSTSPATQPAQVGPACSEDEARAVIKSSGAVAEDTQFEITKLQCDSGWGWGTINGGPGGAAFLLSATGDHWTLVDLGSAICPTNEGMPPDVAARIVGPGEADCG